MRRIVVAVDGHATSDAALAAAMQLAAPYELHVVSVVPAAWDDQHNLANQAQAIEKRRELVEAQLMRVLGGAEDVRVDIRSGSVPAAVASYAQATSASLLIVGLGAPCVRDRLLGTERAFHVARLASTPVLASSPCASIPPRRVVVGMDFFPPSIRSARLARQLVSPDGEMFVVHVEAPGARVVPSSTIRQHADALQRGFPGRVTPVHLVGDAATELLGFANEEGADLLVVGTNGGGPRTRGMLGAVATRVTRCSAVSFFCASDDA